MDKDRDPEGSARRNGVGYREIIGTRQEAGEPLLLTVIFTDRSATLVALRRAAELAHGMKASIRVLVVQTVPRSVPLTCPPVDPLFRARQFSTWFQDTPVSTFFDLRLCRDKNTCLQGALEPSSIVIVGETEHRLWSKSERTLAERLRTWGHEVIFIPAEKKASPLQRLLNRFS